MDASERGRGLVVVNARHSITHLHRSTLQRDGQGLALVCIVNVIQEPTESGVW